MKFACFVDTSAVPMRKPRNPRRSMIAPDEPPPGSGLTNTDPAFWPPGWCSRRHRTISAISASLAVLSPHDNANVADSTTCSGPRSLPRNRNPRSLALTLATMPLPRWKIFTTSRLEAMSLP